MNPGRKRVIFRAMAVLVIVLVIVVLAFMLHEDTPEAKARRLLDGLREPGPIDKLLMKVGIDRRDDPDYEEQIAARLAALGEPAIPVLVETLHKDTREVAECASSALVRIGPKSIPALMESVRERKIGWYTPITLGHLGPLALPSLIEAVGDNDRVVSTCAVEAIRRMGVRGWRGSELAPAAAVLLGKMASDDKYVRDRAGLTLWFIWGPGAKQHLAMVTELLEHPDTEVRCETLGLLSVIEGDVDELVPVVSRMLEEPNDRVRMWGARALANIASDPVAVVERITDALGDRSAVVREAAAKVLGKLGPPAKPAIPALKEALKDENEYVRKAAAEALKKIQEEGATTKPLATP